MRKIFQNSILLAGTFLFLFFLLEISFSILIKERPVSSFKDDYSKAMESDWTMGPYPKLTFFISNPNWKGYFEQNPLFGHSLNRSLPFANNYGFHSHIDFPYQKKEGELVVAIFGASVAEQWYWYLQKTGSAQQKLLDAFGGKFKKIVILNMAISGGKQPQQFHVTDLFIGTYDVAISIEGHNDVIRNIPSKMPIEYPQNTLLLYGLNEKSEMYRDRARIFRKSQAIITHIPLQFTWFIKSHLYHFIWKRMMVILDKLFYRSYIASLSEDDPAQVLSDIEREKQDKTILANWLKYVRLQHFIHEKYKIPHFIFVQPSQYIKEGPPINERNQWEIYTKDELASENNYRRCSILRQAVRDLIRQKDIPIFDLVDLFSQNPQEIFVDECCHINDRGNDLLTQKIAQILMKAPKKSLGGNFLTRTRDGTRKGTREISLIP